MDQSARPSRGYPTTGALLVLSLLVQIPFLDRGLSFLDEGSILAIADGLRQGERLYADRVTPLAPLTYELMAALLRLFGPHILVGRLLQALVLTGCVLLIHRILLVFVDSRWAFWGALAVLVVKPLGFPLWTIVNYSQLALLFCLAAVLGALRFFPSHRQRWLLAAGAAVGMALVTKQNLGAVIGVTVAVGVLLDWIDGREWQLRALAERLGAFAAAAAVPVLAIVGIFAWRGSIGALVGRAVFGLAALADPYHAPLPGLGIWASRTDELGTISFAYFPAPIVQLAWQGGLNLYSRTTFLFVESAVKAAYFLPLAALTGSLVAIWRRPLATAKSARCEELLVFLFAAACYASMLYRADWVHLMNVYPALLLSCVVALANSCAGSWWRKRLAAGVCAVWLAAGVAVTAVVLTVYRTPVHTPRGRLLDAPAAAQNAARVLAYLERQPAEEGIGFLRADPLYYFFARRRVPLRFDLVMPGVVTLADDEEIAARLVDLDQVIYNPKVFPTVPTPITEYAPVTAAALAAGFRVGEVLGDTAVVLVPTDEGRRQEQTVVDLWGGTGDPREGAGSGHGSSAVGHGPSVRRESWMMYRVIGATIEARDVPTCFSVRHFVGPSEAVSVTPMPHPDLWDAPAAGRAASQLRFDIEVETASAPPQIVSSQQCTSLGPGVPVHASLARFAGETVTVRFCASAHGAAAVPLRVGWAEPKIVREGR